MSDILWERLKFRLKEYLKENLTVEVVNPDYDSYCEWPRQPTVKVRILLEGEAVSEDEAAFIHVHNDGD